MATREETQPGSRDAAIDAIAKQQIDHGNTITEVREILIELAGRSGKNGRIGTIEEQLVASRTSQGKRIGKLEEAVGSLKQTKAQLYIVGVIALALLGVVVKMIIG